MKAFVTCGKHPLKSSGGYATYTHTLCKCLKDLGLDVNIIAISDKFGIENTDIGKIHNVTSSYLPTKSSTFITATAIPWSRLFDKLLRNLIKEEERCIIYGIGPWGYAGLGSKQQFGDKVKLVNIFFTTASHEIYWLMKGAEIRDYGIALKLKYATIYLYSLIALKRYEKILAKKSDHLIVHYDFTKNLLIDEYGVCSDKISKLPYYSEIYNKSSLYTKYDTTIGTSKNLKDDSSERKKFTCISICRQEPRKGINYFLYAVKILKDRGLPIKAVVVGSGDLLKKNIRIAKRLKLDEVEFTGFIQNISNKLMTADVFVQPSLQEGSGSESVLEALQAGIPVVTTFCDGLPEDIEQGVTGMLVPKMDSISLANAIEELYKNENLRKKLKENGKRTIKERFDRNAMVNGFGELHKSLWKV